MIENKIEKETKIFAFIKAVEKQYFDSFINSGQICMNTAKWFREYEKTDDNVGDAGEGAIASWGSGFTVSIGDPIEEYTLEEEIKETRDKSSQIDFGPGSNLMLFNDENANILSLYAITVLDPTVKEYKHLVPQKFIDEFSNHRFVLILKPADFIIRIIERLTNLVKSVKGGLVEYYPLDDRIRDNLNFFHKQERLSYQNEYRLISEDKNPEKIIINVGDLSDICLEIDLNSNLYTGKFDNIELTIVTDRASAIQVDKGNAAKG